MAIEVRTLSRTDAKEASLLDKKWFGEYGISEKQLEDYIISHPEGGLAIYIDNIFAGFTTFEILEDNIKPTDYIGNINHTSKTLFIQQFTTITNYKLTDYSVDTELIKAVEEYAKSKSCTEVWEALAIEHPYSTNVNPEYDAIGFYTKHSYSYDSNSTVKWQPNESISIECYLFKKSPIK